jgi:hypothetical protein
MMGGRKGELGCGNVMDGRSRVRSWLADGLDWFGCFWGGVVRWSEMS